MSGELERPTALSFQAAALGAAAIIALDDDAQKVSEWPSTGRRMHA